MTNEYQINIPRLALVIALALVITGCSLGNPSKPTVQVNVNESGANQRELLPGMENDTTTMVYTIEQCAELPWYNEVNPATSPENEATAITQWLDASGIEINATDITIVEPKEGEVFCSACGCPTGRSVRVSMTEYFEDTITQLEQIGFTNINELGQTAPSNEVIAADQQQVADEAVLATQADTVEAATVPAESDPAADGYDSSLRARSTEVQAAIRAFFEQKGHYPATFDELDGLPSTEGMTYTPIGALPAEYYDLVVSYSGGEEVLNP